MSSVTALLVLAFRNRGNPMISCPDVPNAPGLDYFIALT
jgi:hypothetical protein